MARRKKGLPVMVGMTIGLPKTKKKSSPAMLGVAIKLPKIKGKSLPAKMSIEKWMANRRKQLKGI